MVSVKTPELDEERVKELQDMEMELSNLKNLKLRIPMEINELETAKDIVNRHLEEKRFLESKVPGLYHKDIRKMEKELQAINDSIQKKQDREIELEIKINKLQNEIPEFKTQLYGGYVLELSRTFYKLQARALKENTHKFDEIIGKINVLRNSHPLKQYLQRIEYVPMGNRKVPTLVRG